MAPVRLVRPFPASVPTFAVAASALCLLVQFATCDAPFGMLAAPSGPGVEPIVKSAVYVAAGQSGGARVHTQEYIVKGTSAGEVECRVQSPTCGCMNFMLDGEPLKYGTAWRLEPGSARRLAVSLPIPPKPGARQVSFILSSSDPTTGLAVSEQRLEAHATTVSPLIADPSSIKVLAADGAATTREASLLIEATGQNERSVRMLEVSIRPALPGNPGFAVVSCVTLPSSARDHADATSPVRVRHRVTLRCREPSATAFDASGRFQQTLHISYGASEETSASLDVPLTIADPNKFDAPAEINFGAIRSQNTVSRRIIVTSRDARPFRIASVVCENPAVVLSYDGSRLSRLAEIDVGIHTGAPGPISGAIQIRSADVPPRAVTIPIRGTFIADLPRESDVIPPQVSVGHAATN